MTPLLREALAGDSMPARAFRFAMVGGVSGVAYAFFTWLLVDKAGFSPSLASALAYAMVIPVNFGLQKAFTFRSTNPLREETPRYLLVHGANILCAYLAMAATQRLDLDYRVGIVLTIAIVPIVIFLLMHHWVFRATGGGGGRTKQS